MSEVKTICKRTVVSTKPVQPGKFHTLSVLDRVMDPNHHIKMVYYYKTSMALGESTKRLRESLSKMLSSFPAVTGRLLKNENGEWMVKCNDAGVRMVESTAKGSVEEWLSRNYVDREKELELVHWEDMFYKPYFWSTFYVKATEFEEGGLAIGLSCTHLLADPICATIFMKAWANVALGAKMLNPPFFHPLPPRRPGNKNINHKQNTDLINHYKSTHEKHLSPEVANKRLATMALAFPDQMVQSCTTTANTLNSFEALAALFYVCISRAKGKRNGLASMSICLDMRKVLGLDKSYFGNCMVCNRVDPGNGLNEIDELPRVANAIKEVVNKMDVEGIMDLVEWLEETSFESHKFGNDYDELICINLENMDAYSTVFEDGFNPIRFSCYIERSGYGGGQVLIHPLVEGEGGKSRVVTITLPEDEVIKLREDVLLAQFNPTILMGPSIS